METSRLTGKDVMWSESVRLPVVAAVMVCSVYSHAQSWRGLKVTGEDRCSDYDSDDYRYPQALEDDLTKLYGGVYSPYTGKWFNSDTKTHIEHIVARSEAHDSGLCAASRETRRAFARDILNVTLADPATNIRKGGRDAADWLPEFNTCWFASRVVAVKLKYGLTVNAAERDALESVLSRYESADLVVYAR